jgi:hypothetical protein
MRWWGVLTPLLFSTLKKFSDLRRAEMVSLKKFFNPNKGDEHGHAATIHHCLSSLEADSDCSGRSDLDVPRSARHIGSTSGSLCPTNS